MNSIDLHLEPNYTVDFSKGVFILIPESNIYYTQINEMFVRRMTRSNPVQNLYISACFSNIFEWLESQHVTINKTSNISFYQQDGDIFMRVTHD